MSKLDCMYISAMTKMAKVKDDIREFMTSEKGVSNIVATIIILLIVVLLIGVFWEKLQEWLTGIMNDIFGESYDASGLDGVKVAK